MSIEVRFRGDGGGKYAEKYEGPERRGRKKTKRTVIDRVKDDIRETVHVGIQNFLNDGDSGELDTQITYKKAPRGCRDTTDFREDIVRSAMGDVSIELADEAIDVQRKNK